jgi:hypothetical protein
MPYIERAMSTGFAVLVLNTNEAGPENSGADPVRHAKAAWTQIVRKVSSHILPCLCTYISRQCQSAYYVIENIGYDQFVHHEIKFLHHEILTTPAL